MNLLLDTHIFLWLDSTPDKLPTNLTPILEDSNNSLFLSLVSVWEIQIKKDLGKLNLRLPFSEILKEQKAKNGLNLLSIKISHILALETLPSHHKDPFDRLLVAQAQVEDLTLVSCDSVLANYPIKLLN